MNKSIYLAIIAISCSILLISQEYVYAQGLSVTTITPTGGALASTSDCMDIAIGNGIIWHNCNNLLYAINVSTNTVLANISQVIDSTNDRMLASVLGTSVFFLDASASSLLKYTYSGGVISLTGSYTNSLCTTSNELKYDYQGFIWMVCNIEDRILRVNPSTLVTDMISQDLTDAVGLDCDSPTTVHYDDGSNIGAIWCGAGGLTTFSIDSPTLITLIDQEVASTVTEVSIDAQNNNIFVAGVLNEIRLYGYTEGGLMTLEQTTALDADEECTIEPILSVSSIIVCYEISGANTILYGFKSNSTGLFTIMNTLVSGFNNPIGIGLDVTEGAFGTWLISSNTNNQRYIKIEGLREISENPDPIDEDEDTGTIGGVDCTLPENENLLTCRLGGDGTIGGAGDFIIGDGSEGTGLSGIACSIGFVDCSVNDDVKTNGIGYLIFIAGVAIMFGLFWIITKGHITEIPTFIWIISILSLAGAFALFNIIDPVIFIVTIVAIIALAVPKIISTIRGDTSTLGAGNTS